MPAEHKFTFRRKSRLSGKLTFSSVFEEGKKATRGPIAAFAKRNGLEHSRLGLSISRRVGTAPRRNAIKRKLREAFRLSQHDWPEGYDVVLVARPHAPLQLAEYQKILSGLMVKLHGEWRR